MKGFWSLVVLGVSLTLVGAIRAQDYDSTVGRQLVGMVLVRGGAPPPGRAQVILYNSINIYLEQSYTNSSGSFAFQGIGSGNFRIVVKLAGYQDGSADVSIYRGSIVAKVPPIVLSPLVDSQPAAAEGLVEAAELKLGKEGRTSYQKARLAMDKGEPEEARNLLERTTELEPDFAHAHHLLGVAENLLGDYKKAEASFERAIELDPHRADSYFGLGKTQCLLNRPAEALLTINKGLQLSPDSTLGLFEKSRAQFMLRDFVSAEQTARESLARSSLPPSEVHLILANSYLYLRRYPEAAAELDTYLKLEPKSTSAPKAREVLRKLEGMGITPKSVLPQK